MRTLSLFKKRQFTNILCRTYYETRIHMKKKYVQSNPLLFKKEPKIFTKLPITKRRFKFKYCNYNYNNKERKSNMFVSLLYLSDCLIGSGLELTTIQNATKVMLIRFIK
jgi:hypothetical protein